MLTANPKWRSGIRLNKPRPTSTEKCSRNERQHADTQRAARWTLPAHELYECKRNDLHYQDEGLVRNHEAGASAGEDRRGLVELSRGKTARYLVRRIEIGRGPDRTLPGCGSVFICQRGKRPPAPLPWGGARAGCGLRHSTSDFVADRRDVRRGVTSERLRCRWISLVDYRHRT